MSDQFYDLNEVGEELLEVVEQLGEDIIFELDDGTTIQAKACFSDNMTSAEPSAGKAYRITGEMTFGNYQDIEMLRGSYFTKVKNPTKTYILVSTTENPFTDKVANVEVAECNKTISIGYEEKVEDERGEMVYVFTEIYKDVKVFIDTDIKTPQTTQVGELPKTIMTITIPSDYAITTDLVVQMKEFRRIKSKSPPVYEGQIYNIVVDSVNTNLMTTYDDVTFFGVTMFDIVKKV